MIWKAYSPKMEDSCSVKTSLRLFRGVAAAERGVGVNKTSLERQEKTAFQINEPTNVSPLQSLLVESLEESLTVQ